MEVGGRQRLATGDYFSLLNSAPLIDAAKPYASMFAVPQGFGDPAAAPVPSLDPAELDEFVAPLRGIVVTGQESYEPEPGMVCTHNRQVWLAPES